MKTRAAATPRGQGKRCIDMVAIASETVQQRRLRIFCALMEDLVRKGLRATEAEDLGSTAVVFLDIRKLNNLFADEGVGHGT